MNTEEDIFLKKMAGVRPIKKKNNLRKEIKKTKAKKNLLKKSIIGEIKTNEKKQKKITKYEKIEPNKTSKSLRRGKIKIDRKIDFHGCTLVEAEAMFKESIYTAYNEKKRCILFVTGKGLYSQKIKPIKSEESKPRLFHGKIRSSFSNWIQKPELLKYIMAAERASPEHGGDGAFYVYLRKNKN